MIAWESYSGECIEQVIATYICLQFPSAVHIRPSQGDGGIDVIRSLGDGSYAVYQIKRFARNLGASQKKQIEKSWKSVLEYFQEKGLILKKWYLAMPLDPTKENLEWLNKLTSDSEIEASWLGKTHIEGWSAKMPYVADYYLQANRDAILKIAKNMLGATCLDVADISSIVHQINNLQLLLNDLDPNYAYDLQILSDYNRATEAPLVSKPGLVMSSIMEMDNGRAIQIDVFAKHGASTELAPITGKINFFAEDEVQAKKLREFLDYGVPIIEFPALVKSNGPLLFGKQAEFEKATVTAYNSNEEAVFNLVIHNKSGNTMDVVQSSFNKGKKGAIWIGSTSDQMFSIEMKTLYSNYLSAINITYNQNYFTQYPISAICKKLRFLVDGIDDEFSITLGGSELCRFSFGSLEIKKDEIIIAYRIAQLLALLDAVALEDVSFPSKISREEFNDLSRAVELIQDKQIIQCWEKLEPDLIDDSIFESFDTEFFAIKFLLNRSLILENNCYHYGYVRHEIVGMWDKSKNAFIPTGEYGKEAKLTYVGSVNSTEMQPGTLYVAPIKDIEFLDENKRNCCTPFCKSPTCNRYLSMNSLQ